MLDQLVNSGGAGSASSGMSVAGMMGQSDLEALQKSLSAGYETDVNGMSGGSALRVQSLDTTMQATVQDNQHFTLFNMLSKPKATAVLDEWTEQHSIGGFFGGTFNTQDGAAMETNGEYNRMVGMVKYMTTYRKVPIVLNAQNNIADAITLETTNGTKQLLTDIEVGLFEGDDTVCPLVFPGIRRQLESLQSTDNVIDMAGQALSNIDPIAKAAENIFGFGSFGRATDIFLPTSVQTDLNMDLDPAFRIALDGNANSTIRGTHVAGVQTSYGKIQTRSDVFVRDEKLKKPFQIRNKIHAAVAASNVGFMPQSVVPTAAAGGADSAWTGPQAGNFYYFVTGINQNGESTGVLTAQVAVAAGQQVSLVITSSLGGTETGYVIYRSRMNGTNNLTDLREMDRVPKSQSGPTTTYIDKNRKLPGSTCSFVLNLTPSDHAIAWRQFLPMMKIPMAAVNSPIIPWLQMICGYLRVTKRAQHVAIVNIVPNGAAWKPFG